MRKPHTGEPDACEPVVYEIVQAVATRESVDPLDLTPPLSTVIDPEALNRLFASSTTATAARSGRITFEYCGYEVTVHGDGTVAVEETPAKESASDETVQSV